MNTLLLSGPARLAAKVVIAYRALDLSRLLPSELLWGFGDLYALERLRSGQSLGRPGYNARSGFLPSLNHNLNLQETAPFVTGARQEARYRGLCLQGPF